MNEEQKDLVMQYFTLPHYIMKMHFPYITPGTPDYEDMTQTGYEALCLAAIRFDGSTKFISYAYAYVWGKITTYYNKYIGWNIVARTNGGTKIGKRPYCSYEEPSGIGKDGEELLLKDSIEDPGSIYLYDCAIYADCARECFRKACKKHGVDILDLLLRGHSQREIAKELNTSQTQVSRIIKKAYMLYNKED